MKYILIVGDGMADYPVPELGNKTPLEAAYKPNMNSIAAKGRSGVIKAVPDDLTPGSDTAILSVLGYDPKLFCTGRGALEAAARGIELEENDAAFRCNIITEKNGVLLDYSAGHITSSESAQLIESVKLAFEKPGAIEFYPGLDYRHFLILRNFPNPSLIECTPPHDAAGAKISTILPRAKSKEAQKTVAFLNEAILKSKEILESHPVNIARMRSGKNPGNMIWPWGGGKKPCLPSFKGKYGLDAAGISAVALGKGSGTCGGMQVIGVKGATGLSDTNSEGRE